MKDKLNEILKGIDKTQCESDDGWWETTVGAEFGAKKLKEVQELVKKLTLANVSQQRELLINFLEFLSKENALKNGSTELVYNYIKRKTKGL